MLRTGVLTMGVILAMAGCGGSPKPPPDAAAPRPGTFADDLAFLRAHTSLVVLAGDGGRAQVVVAPGYQGRVMTSTAAGADGVSFGYIHRPVIELGTRQPHMTVLGGEDRFWLGPEGGQYALYFPPSAAFDNDHWQVPEPLDWGAWPVVSQTAREVTFAQPMTVSNYARTTFTLRVDRTIRLLDRSAIARALGGAPGAGTSAVAYESDNRVTNTGTAPWRKDTGLISIWILGMMTPGPRTTVVIPYHAGSGAERGPVVNDAYFGAPPADRLHIGDKAIFFRGDGKQRGKIGVPEPRAGNVAASYDPDRRVLTIMQFTGTPAGRAGYVNSMWALEKNPYGGDVINSYNDGPLGPGQPPLGPFYELEASSPAAALAPGQAMAHLHRTIHLQGPDAELDEIAKTVLGVSLAEIGRNLP